MDEWTIYLRISFFPLVLVLQRKEQTTPIKNKSWSSLNLTSGLAFEPNLLTSQVQQRMNCDILFSLDYEQVAVLEFILKNGFVYLGGLKFSIPVHYIYTKDPLKNALVTY